MRALRAGLAGVFGSVMGFGFAQPAAAVSSNCVQHSGFFFPGADATGTLRAGQDFGLDVLRTNDGKSGGLEFFELDAGVVTGNAYHLISWGCPIDGLAGPPQNNAAGPGVCSNNGV